MNKVAKFRRRKGPRHHHQHSACRPYMIDAEEFDFMDDCEMYDWMYGNPAEVPQ